MKVLKSFALAAFPISCLESIGQSVGGVLVLVFWNIAQPSIFWPRKQICLWDVILEDHLWWDPGGSFSVHNASFSEFQSYTVPPPTGQQPGVWLPGAGESNKNIRILYFCFFEVIIYFFNCTFTCALGRCVYAPKCIKWEAINRSRGIRYQEGPVLLELTAAWRRWRSTGPTRRREPDLSSARCWCLLGNCCSGGKLCSACGISISFHLEGICWLACTSASSRF